MDSISPSQSSACSIFQRVSVQIEGPSVAVYLKDSAAPFSGSPEITGP